MFWVYAFINKLHLLNLIFLFILFLANASFAFSDFDSEGMILILIATMLADWLYFYLSVHNSPLLTFISGIWRLVRGQKIIKDRRYRAKDYRWF